MNKWFMKKIYYLLADFIDQIIAAIILIIAFTAWVYFSSIYIAILVVIIGIFLWSLLTKSIKSRTNKVNIKDSK
jgi:Flp pilus assembly protein TadB